VKSFAVSVKGSSNLSISRQRSSEVRVSQVTPCEEVVVGEDGQVHVRPALVRDIQSFARVWDRNLKNQGFVEAAAR
jgi:hypothetical protein